MSVESIRRELRKFVTGKGGAVLSVRGPWGVGKTWAWDDILRTASLSKTTTLKRYAYVSLFGINSLDGLKAAIFEATVNIDGQFPMPTEGTFSELIAGASKSGGRGLAKYLETMPVLKNFLPGGAIAALSFLTVRDMIICFDDLERKGKGLELTDVLGLASMLKERRHCRVALLLNNEEFEVNNDKAVFERYLEKVTDQSLHFNPTSAESVKIATGGATPISDRAAELCLKLGIRNIRIMKRAERLLAELKAILTGYDQRVLDGSSASLVLFAWSHFDTKSAPSFEFLVKYNQVLSQMMNEPATPEEGAWKSLLSDYGYASTDDFDKELMKAVEQGYFVESKIKEHAEELQRTLQDADREGSFRSAWNLFHDSFDVPDDKVVEAIDLSFRKGLHRLSPSDLSATVKLFKDLGKQELAQPLIEIFMAQDKPRQFFNLDEYAFREHVADPEVIAAFAARAGEVEEVRDFVAILKKLNSGWDDEDVAALAALSVAEYCAIFRGLKGVELRSVIASALMFDRITNADEHMREIPRRAREALAMIGRESKINALRVAKYGVQPD